MRAYDVQVQRFWLNRLLCWHGQECRRLQFSQNGVVSYCDKCFRKHTSIHDFGNGHFKEPYR